jgi:hypothetical protein
MTPEMLAPMVASRPYAAGGTMGDFLIEESLVTMSQGTTRVDASVLDVVLGGEMMPVHDPAQPIEVPVVAVAADPAMPDAVTTPGDLARLEAMGVDVRTHTLAGANHLIHDTIDQREPFWSIVEQFLDNLP